MGTYKPTTQGRHRSSQRWKKVKKLGSLLGDEEDIERRKVLATASFKSLRLLWERKRVTSIETRIRAYNAFVLPVLLYNCGTWGVKEKNIENIDVYHRRHLREVLGIRKRELSNEELYEKCGVKTLKKSITKQRWELFGHVLRLDRQTPAQIAMDYYTQLKEGEGEPLGKPETTLPVLLFSEFKKYMLIKQQEKGKKTYQRTRERMLQELRELAWDRKEWEEMKNSIIDF